MGRKEPLCNHWPGQPRCEICGMDIETDPTPTPEQPRCQARAGWCEKPAGHEGDHYTTYRPGETWWEARPEQDEAVRLAEAVLRFESGHTLEELARRVLATPPPVPAAPGLDEGLLAAVMLERGLSMQHVHGVIDTYRALLSPVQEEAPDG